MKLARQFHNDMQPETVLFLRKLVTIKLWYPVTSTVKGGLKVPLPANSIRNVVYSRTEQPNGIDVEVSQTNHLYTAVPLTGKYITQNEAPKVHRYRRGEHAFAQPACHQAAIRTQSGGILSMTGMELPRNQSAIRRGDKWRRWFDARRAPSA